MVFRDLVDVATSLLHHWLNLRSSQKARTQRLIPDALRQPLDDRRRLPKGGAHLFLLSTCLIHPSQYLLNLPLFCWQAELCSQPCCLAQVADGLLAVSLPGCQGRQRPQVGKAVAPIGPQAFSQPVNFLSRLALIPPRNKASVS